jgi:hypothetical protein
MFLHPEREKKMISLVRRSIFQRENDGKPHHNTEPFGGVTTRPTDAESSLYKGCDSHENLFGVGGPNIPLTMSKTTGTDHVEQ